MLGLNGVTPNAAIYPRGAGRWFDWQWPPYAGTVTAAAIGRGGMATYQNASVGGAGATVGTGKVAGAPCTSINVGAGSWLVQLNDRIVIMTERSGGDLGEAPACWEFYAIAAFSDPTAPVLGDTGVCIASFSGNYVDTDGATHAAGVRFGPTGPGAAELRMRAINGGAYSVQEAVASVKLPDFTILNRWALRIVGGLATEDPYIVGLVNGAEVTDRYSLTAAAGKFPAPDAVSATSLGYVPFFAVRPGGAGIIPNVGLVRYGILGAGSLDALL